MGLVLLKEGGQIVYREGGQLIMKESSFLQFFSEHGELLGGFFIVFGLLALAIHKRKK
jgi:hypothetical protein